MPNQHGEGITRPLCYKVVKREFTFGAVTHLFFINKCA